MNFKKLFSKNKLSKYLSFRQNGNIWRIFTDNKLIAGETRDIENKQVYFFAINYETCRSLLMNHQINEKWWTSICNATDKFIFLSSYRKPDMPEYLGITVIDIFNGNIRWQRDDLTYLFSDDEYVYAYKQLFESKKYYRLKVNSGEIINEFTENEIDSIFLLKQKLEAERYKDFLYPLVYNAELNNTYPEYFSLRFSKTKIKGFIEYSDYKNFLIYNYHEIKDDYMNSTISNKLEIFDKNIKKIIYEEILNKNVSNYVPDSFFIKDSYLFYIKEKTELISVKL